MKEAIAPGRVCFGGESLDWMTNGSSVVGAIGLQIRASVEELPAIRNYHLIYLQSKSPYPAETIYPYKGSHWYADKYLKYVESAVDFVRHQIEGQYSFKVVIESNVPAKAGVSSSAAVTLATTAAVASFFDKEQSVTELCENAYYIESEKLRTGAGKMDFYACGIGGLLYLNCGTSPAHVEPFVFPEELGVVVVDTRTPHETKSFISSKRNRFMSGDKEMVYYAAEAERLVERMHELLPDVGRNQEEIGELMNRFHELLRNYVHCSTHLLDECVSIARNNGALGAKLTGSGMGGCMFALVRQEDMEKVAEAYNDLPVSVYQTSIVNEGVHTLNSHEM